MREHYEDVVDEVAGGVRQQHRLSQRTRKGKRKRDA
jgi:hypothetical protein